jgi:hypothetical protein
MRQAGFLMALVKLSLEFYWLCEVEGAVVVLLQLPGLGDLAR